LPAAVVRFRHPVTIKGVGDEVANHLGPTAAAALPAGADSGEADAPPDWENLEEDLHCSRCDYNLRMLERPRCPECGLVFAWRDLLDAARRRSEFLFEHRWRDRPVRSWLLTLRRSLRPGRFWAGVSIHEHPDHRALWAYLILGHGGVLLCFMVFAIAIPAALDFTWDYFWLNYRISLWRIYLFETALDDLELFLPFAWSGRWVKLALIIVPVWVILLTLCGLRQTLARCRIRTIHMFRTVAYIGPGLMVSWFAILLGVVLAKTWCDDHPVLPATAAVGYTLPLFLHLRAAGRFYLGIPRPNLTAAVLTMLGCLAGFLAFVIAGEL
jgi:hypothetical protein